MEHPEITLTDEDCAYEPGYGEEIVQTGELQAEVPTDKLPVMPKAAELSFCTHEKEQNNGTSGKIYQDTSRYDRER
jgi:hypothetical protein